ncbi:long-chain fatty acid--CoA ligase [Paraburkholderia humisilvae]|uniref:Tyrocidine synthase 3 n=1 Tax=Paraburkholderia humisilvae TaxID=627669 RepID=A0A6J5EH19_9BURK|nr:long-chain fatty acid--CoA ligase [Paraburkholderia humisilvae]CAB3765838.1 Tyrocidine synthase 3 [Paraburkholderia humisilvae]
MGWITERFEQFGTRQAAVGQTGSQHAGDEAASGVTYAELAARIARWRAALDRWGIVPGERVGLVADYHIDAVALLMALIEAGCIVAPLSEDDRTLFDERLTTTSATRMIAVAASGPIAPETTRCVTLSAPGEPHPLLAPLVEAGRAGFVIFTSGSTGKGKAVLLDFERITRKYRDRVRHAFRTLLFLKLDHIGGINTLFAVLLNGGTIVTCASRNARDICACIAAHAVELLPTTPSFLTMLLMSRVYLEHDLSSLRTITYGTEVMPASTLASLHQVFPDVTLKQTYGLSELGILSTRSKDSSSPWLKLGGAGFEVQVRDGVLWIRSEQAMLGYLNAPSPFDADGWYDTGDRVETDGEYYRILGRDSEVINVAGEKVFPAEIESFLLTLDNVRDVIVRRKRSPVVGQMIWAEFVLERDEDPAEFRRRITSQCVAQLSPYKVPGHITIAERDSLVGSRFKKIRKEAAATPAMAASGDPQSPQPSET